MVAKPICLYADRPLKKTCPAPSFERILALQVLRELHSSSIFDCVHFGRAAIGSIPPTREETLMGSVVNPRLPLGKAASIARRRLRNQRCRLRKTWQGSYEEASLSRELRTAVSGENGEMQKLNGFRFRSTERCVLLLAAATDDSLSPQGPNIQGSKLVREV
jgi:hypothetical protein